MMSRLFVLGLTAAALVGACGSPTGIESLTVSVREIAFTTDEARTSWPGTPTVLGGDPLRVRGTALVGCGSARGTAVRRGDIVHVDISAVNTEQFCLGIRPAWQPFEASVTGLPAGSYRVRVTVVGYDGRAEWRVATGSQ